MRIARARNYLWLWWIIASLLGFVGAITIKTTIEILAEIGGFTAALESIPPTLFGTFFGAMLGISNGLAQWLVLRRRVAGVGAWVLATLITLIVFWTLHNAEVFGFAHTPWGLVGQGFGHGTIVGAMLGTAQYLVLRGRIKDAIRWVLISTASWSAAGAIMHFLLDVALGLPGNYGPFDVLIASLLAALFSGSGLQRLLERPSNKYAATLI
jgi:hypothetical protein